MKTLYPLRQLVATSLVSMSLLMTSAHALDIRQQTNELRDQWSGIVFTVDDKQEQTELAKLRREAKALLSMHPEDAELLTWTGIISSSYASAKGGLGALKVADEARQYFVDAMAINPEAFDGGARTSLGVLYYKVPGWPLSFGSKEKAEALLRESAQKYAGSLNAQYFLGEFLFEQKRFIEAQEVLRVASNISPRQEFMQVDRARLEQIGSTLQKLKAIVGSAS